MVKRAVRTTVKFCENKACAHNDRDGRGHCLLPEIHLIISYGRSTDYEEKFTCSEATAIGRE